MAKILLVEDDLRQMAWAEQSLTAHELFQAGSMKEYQEFLRTERMFNLVITDLFLPGKPGGAPDYTLGLDIFDGALRGLAREEIQGAALVSNFEHHVAAMVFGSEGHNEDSSFGNTMRILNRYSRSLGKRLETQDDKLIVTAEGGKRAWNMMFVVDLDMDNYTHFLSPDGRVLTKAEIGALFSGRKYITGIEAIKEGYLNLKPYSVIVEGLLSED